MAKAREKCERMEGGGAKEVEEKTVELERKRRKEGINSLFKNPNGHSSVSVATVEKLIVFLGFFGGA